MDMNVFFLRVAQTATHFSTGAAQARFRRSAASSRSGPASSWVVCRLK